MAPRSLPQLVCWVALFALPGYFAAGQTLRFNNLGIRDGLTSNVVNDVAVDRNGYLWIATADGLDRYDGYAVERVEPAPDQPTVLFCDRTNRLWVGSRAGLGWLENRHRMEPVTLGGNTAFQTYDVFETQRGGVVAYTSLGHFQLDEKTGTWQKLTWLPLGPIPPEGILDIAPAPDDQFLYCTGQVVRLVDFRRRRITFEFDVSGLGIGWSAVLLNRNELLLAVSAGELWRINLAQKRIVKRYPLFARNRREALTSPARQLRRGADGNVYIATFGQGLMVFNPTTERLLNHGNDALVPGSLSSNRFLKIDCTADGYVVAVHASGVSICNPTHEAAGYIPVFLDEAGRAFGGTINDAVQETDSVLYLAAEDRLIRWNRVTNESQFFFIRLKAPGTGTAPGTPLKTQIKSVWLDRRRRLWVSAYAEGVGIFTPKTGTFRPYLQDSAARAFGSSFLHDLVEGPDGQLWTGSGLGVYSIDPATLRRRGYDAHPLLGQVSGKRVFALFFDPQKRLWMGTESDGIYCYDARANTLQAYGRAQGITEPCTDFEADAQGTVYAATGNGLLVVGKDRVTLLNRANGLRANRVKALLRDRAGSIWFDNGRFIVRYQPQHRRFTYFDENEGFMANGFRANATYLAPDGTAYFGGLTGLNAFRPEELNGRRGNLAVNIGRVLVNDEPVPDATAEPLRLGHRQNALAFEVVAIDLMGSRNVTYQHQLVGVDATWQTSGNRGTIRYSALAPGAYRFRLRASKDGTTWVAAPREVTVEIAQPLWRRPWFVAAAVVALALGLLAWQRRRERVLARKSAAELERQRLVAENLGFKVALLDNQRKAAEAKLQSLRLQMNPHFLFNALNSIQQMIMTGNERGATLYLSKFSKLLRLVLTHSDRERVTLREEIALLHLYLELEALRFDETFQFEIRCDEAIDQDEAQVPTLLIQPFVENAIWHGLLPKEGPRRLWVMFEETGDEVLRCTVRDNGVGRAAAREAARLSVSYAQHTGKGLHVAAERLQAPGSPNGKTDPVRVVDLQDECGHAAGTEVVIELGNRETN